MIKSTKTSFYKIESMYGVKQAHWRPSHRSWGTHRAIKFLEDLEREWTVADRLYGQIDDFGDFEPILLGDLSVEGGRKDRNDRMPDHKSHLSGNDIDIYIFKTPGHQKDKQRSINANNYDRARTFEMMKVILELGNSIIKRIFFDDKEMIRELKGLGLGGGMIIGPDPGRPKTEDHPALPPTPHQDHLHIRFHPA